jgi:general secretion pathway protein G
MDMDLHVEPVMTTETYEKSTLEKIATARSLRREQLGMTLIEIMIVLAIIALVMGLLVGPTIINKLQQAKVDVAKQTMTKIEAAYTSWQTNNSGKDCPESVDELKADMGKRQTDQIKDPWGHDYVIKCGDQAPEECEGFCVISLGKDGKEGTGDDIKSWAAKK